MARLPRSLALILALALVASALRATPSLAQGSGVGPALGSQAPDAALEDMAGNAVRISDYMEAGKPTLIEFWATWCENCEELQPQMDAVAARYGDRVNVLAVAVAVAQSQRRVNRHLERHDPQYPHLWDASGEAVRNFQAATTSIVVLVDGDGKVAYTGVGGDQDLVSAVERVLAGE
jgi:thiol-disulfide isomerase/thioredoxin